MRVRGLIAASTLLGGLLAATGPAALTAGSAPATGSPIPIALAGNAVNAADSPDFLPTPRTVRTQRSAPPSTTATTTALDPAAATVVLTSLGIPEIVLNAYRSAELVMMTEAPGCGVPWHLLAGIGRIESGHANGGRTTSVGTTVTPIFGPVLDGRLAGNQIITDTDKGLIDGDPTHDRAVGPMQFIPSTWAHYASDGNGDGVTDPNNVFDAALSAAKYLCSGGLDLRNLDQETKAVLRYNNSAAYAANVIMWSTAYKSGVLPSGSLPYTGGINTGSINTGSSDATSTAAILAAAAAVDPTAEKKDGDQATAAATPAPLLPGLPDMPALSPDLQALIPPGVLPTTPNPSAPGLASPAAPGPATTPQAPTGPIIPLPVLTSRGLVWPILTPTGWTWPDDMCVILPDPVALAQLQPGIHLPCAVPTAEASATTPAPATDATTTTPSSVPATTSDAAPAAVAPSPAAAPAPAPAPAPLLPGLPFMPVA
ncbi:MULTISPECIES: lytic transglycosylase domain-containing protein [Rhodococcus]|uniref:lytic transglycosylase domain-containing protein n=1 Tax=Rhodococcus TaxID=1827 RepID=UPI000E265218|nr:MULTISPECIES: lytic murein transglycosylase [Rhodococcus]RZL26964.1 MAG: lytic transglycosylase [Rhodococcus sp. (in: high G+C Gram-positive bacteria)]